MDAINVKTWIIIIKKKKHLFTLQISVHFNDTKKKKNYFPTLRYCVGYVGYGKFIIVFSQEYYVFLLENFLSEGGGPIVSPQCLH